MGPWAALNAATPASLPRTRLPTANSALATTTGSSSPKSDTRTPMTPAASISPCTLSWFCALVAITSAAPARTDACGLCEHSVHALCIPLPR